MTATAEAVAQKAQAIRVERGVPVAMRDGTILRADVYRPRTADRYPVLVERVPYDLARVFRLRGEYFAARGYVCVVENLRGTFASEGKFSFFEDDGWGVNRDGHDTVEWASAQPWSNGRVATLGGSAAGYTQYLLAPTRPPHLRTMLVRQAPSDLYHDYFARGGAHQLWVLRDWVLRLWLLPQLQHPSAPAGSEALAARLQQAHAEIDSWCRHLPLNSFPPVDGLADWYFEQLAHPEDGPYWWNRNVGLKVGEIDVPILHVTSWFDLVLDGVLRCFRGIRAHGRNETARRAQRVVIGPWIHGPDAIASRQAGELDFGPQAELDFNGLQLAWFDHWLKDVENDVMSGSPIRLFLMGANHWLDIDEWPPAGTVTTPLYLREGHGRDASSLNNGSLTIAPADAAERADSFVYDPDHPIPSLLTYPQLGPRDHRPVEGRLLTYTTDPLERDLAVIGPVKAVLYALSSAPDTDWVVRLCDVWPDGRSMSVCDGILRARYRDSFERPELIRPGQLYRFEIGLSPTAQVFSAGHRVRVEVTSSDFPRYDRNLNTGGRFGEEVRGQVAVNTIFHDASRASHILLPLLSTGSTL